MYMMSAAWGSLAIVLSALGGVYAWFAFKRQGWRGLVRGAALVMMPIALWLTGTLRLVGFIVDWFASWATGLVLSPSVIAGTVLFVLSVVLFGASTRISKRDRPVRAPAAGAPAATDEPRPAKRVGARGAPAVADDDMADIEALLRQRGIS